MKKRLLSLFLCAVMIFGFVPGLAAAAKDTGLNIYCDGEQVSNIGLPEKTPVTVKALLSESTAGSFQWQIRVSNGVWANIIGSSDNALTLRYAMVANLLNEDGQAVVRCRFTPVDGKAIYSNELTVQMVSDMALMTIAAAEENSFTFTVLDPGSVIIHDTAKEPEKTPAPTETPASDESAAPSEEPAPTEEPAAPTEEPAPAEESAAPADPAEESAAPAEESVAPAEESAAETETVSLVSFLGLDSFGLKAYADEGESTPDVKTTYSVVINYKFENNQQVADSYVATLAEGSPFSATVNFPTVQGYLPYVNDVQQNSYEINIASVSEDMTINVVYKPTNVEYTVIHYQQNVDNDQYTEVARDTKQGLTNSTVPDVANTYEGFFALLYEKPAIAADGSTVVEVYYDRYYYLMNFDLDGGYGVEPVYARYGAPITDVGTPTKAGYSFKGWSLDGATTVSIPGTMPAENRTYKALWEADATAKVKVVFWGENADDEEYSYIKSAEVNVKPDTEFTYSEDGTLICALETHTHSFEENCYSLTCTQEVHEHSESCYTCSGEIHTHNVDCYEGMVGSPGNPSFPPSNPDNGQIYKGWLPFFGSWSYIYINGVWYNYTGSLSDGEVATPTCGKTEGTHEHSDTCLGCGKTEHTHSVENGCYTLTCGKTAHKHTSDCYMNGAGLDSNLWKFVRSETVTVAADGSSVVNVYYDRTEKTLTFKYNYSNRNGYRSTETITAKWGSDISVQYKKIAANAGSTFWSAQTSGEGPYTNYFGVMPENSATYYNRGRDGNNGTMTYWGQDLNGEYTVKLFEVTGVGGYTVTDEDRYKFEGFTYHHGTANGSSCIGAAFYYTRDSYTLTFNDGYDDVKTETVLYEAPLSTYSSYVPPVPSAKEPGSVKFGGWYLNPECTGAEFKLDEHKMPADNILLYAKWVPVSHKVEFYLDKAALDAGTKLSTHPDITVPHGSLADPKPADPTNGSYTFVGWFYMEDGVEKAFDFANMPVNKDLKVYGKWSSNKLMPYTIYYKIKDTDTEIAAPTTGSGLAGATKTFDAKGGTELYTDYQEGYFPVTKSHSMTLDINATPENDTNVFTFWYVQKDAIPYTVKYLNKVTGEPVADEKTVSDNRKAVVTETFVPVPGMMPDAYQKRLVVSAEEGAVNEIIFYYTEDTTHAYYKITHYTENLGKDAQGNTTWTEYASSQAVGDIGTIYNADPMTIPGFTYDSTVSGTVISGELTANGLELKLYYTRNSYPYQVRYLEQGTGKQLAEPKDGTGKYGQVVSESAIDIDGYDAVDPTSQTLNIRIEESSTEAKLNIITFYYKEKEVTINYRVVGPAGCGTVTPASETLKVLSGTAQGSTATANENFRFVGWYKDEECTQPVDADWVKDSKLTPGKTKNYGTAEKPVMGYEAATYYAKFEYDVADLTITKTGCVDTDLNQSFIFTITGPDGYRNQIVIKGNGSVTIKGLKIGEYTIHEESGWSWRYSCADQKVTLKGGADVTNSVTMANSRDNDKWLDNNASADNIFTGAN